MIKSSRGKGRTKPKQKEEERAREFINALNMLCAGKGIEPEVLYEAIEEALVNAYHRDTGTNADVRVELNRETGSFHIYARKNIVEEVADEVREISLGEAQAINPDYQVGDILEIDVTPANFGRIAAQNAKQMVVQKIREAERGIIYDEFSSQESDIVTGMIERVDKQHVYINLGKTAAMMALSEQVIGETYRVGETIKAFIIEVKKTNKGPQIVVSRTHPGLLKRLFENEVPEIADGTVEIKSVAREPGMRSKIAVHSNDEDVDPVGSCVGLKGMRVQAIVNELRNEKIDIVKWSADPAKYIANALSPAQVLSVAVNEEEKISRVIVPDEHLSLAIGKEGQNARLAAKLTGWKIDIKSESQIGEDGADEAMSFVEIGEAEAFNAEEV